MKRNIKGGFWQEVKSEEHFQSLRETARVRKGYFSGPGKYRLLSYTQPCPRGCCYDDVIELISVEDYTREIREEMTTLAELLRQCRTGSTAVKCP